MNQTTMNCTKCGEQIGVWETFCGACNFPVKQMLKSNAMNKPHHQTAIHASEPIKDKVTLTTIIGVCGVLAVVGVVLFSIIGNDGNRYDPTPIVLAPTNAPEPTPEPTLALMPTLTPPTIAPPTIVPSPVEPEPMIEEESGGITLRVEEQRIRVEEQRIIFTDMQHLSAEMQRAIMTLATQGIISGTAPGRFNPDATISRAEFARIITGMLGIFDPNAASEFEDVRRTDWFFGAVGSAYRHGLMTGTSPTTFSPNDVITRHYLAVVSARVLMLELGIRMPADPDAVLQTFTDSDSLEAWSVGYLALATRHNLVGPREDGSFSPNELMTRGDAALILYRLYLRLW